MKNKIQKEDFMLPGGLGSVNIGGNNQEITKVFKSKDGATTLTISPKIENEMNNAIYGTDSHKYLKQYKKLLKSQKALLP